MTISKELKEAISYLPSTEKDKLIFRLLKKDLMLANRLMFELVNTNSVDVEREKMKAKVLLEVRKMIQLYYSVGYLHVDMRYLSGQITDYVAITKDKFGEAYLNLIMTNEILMQGKDHILATTVGQSLKFCVSIIARAFKIILLVKKLDEDYFMEFQDELKRLGNLIIENKYLMKSAVNHGFDVNWLLLLEIPENIAEIHKKIRNQGLLK